MSDHLQSESNPFAPPGSGAETSEIRLEGNEACRAIGKYLYCRAFVDLTDICWLTGSTTGLVGEEEHRESTLPTWYTWVLTGGFLSIFFVEAWSPTGGFFLLLQGSIILTLMILTWIIRRTVGHAFHIKVGRSRRAHKAARAFILFVWLQIGLFLACFTLFCLFLWSNGEFIEVFVCGWVAVWGVTSISMYIKMKPERFAPNISPYNDSLFIVSGLRSEFLKAVSAKQANTAKEHAN